MKIHMISLGCDKNRVDSEKMLSNLLEKYPGSELTDDPAEADITVINTCAFIGDAKEESINTIIENGEYKETGRLKKLIVAGCLAERYREEIRKELPEVDEVIGVKEYVERLDVQMKRVENAENYTAYLKIAEGCDKCCTYCIIPKLRGHYRSVPMEHLLEEAKRLASEGTKELILVAQETTLYGVDLYGKKSLPELLNRLSEIEGLEWIRILYCYPEEITDELIQTIRDNPKVVHYLDIPIQHASDKILKNMHRRTRESELRERIATLRREIPDIALRTTLITGFPGETEEDFDILKNFVTEMRFDRLGVFLYSQEEDTPAAEMEGQVPEKIKLQRQDEIMRLQQGIAFEKARKQIGRELRVIIVGYDPEHNEYLCRSYMDNPDIDSLVYVDAGEYHNELSGDMISCRIIEADGYDLIGERI
ncbi:MAG: 30S ribosomal protein S12 methylthiotransferase RimO [Oribacterium sp.]|uniref:30S ribosomal protein S12 methylthiotransferase RimO n=1 Tax=Oribacterium sp. Sow4_G1_1 TaxID=3438794 RepID=UPI002A768811|nr:30S ribosomal protein S12 methylthiotransferase RimO [Oribacterium sp.]MDY2855202.1 30S ribosomal protein S12 methylthiotransferase RimO [Oliverpabstia sp.]